MKKKYNITAVLQKGENKMTKKYLNQIFKMVLGYDYENSVESKDLRYMHQIIYLLQELGFPADEYGFSWCIYEIYSVNLQKDIMRYNFNKQTRENIKFRKEFIEKINKLKKIIESEQKGNYSTGQWLDCLSSLCYLKKYIMPPNSSDNELIRELQHIKPYLWSQETNKKACTLIMQNF